MNELSGNRVVVVGGGFGGLEVARRLRRKDAEVTLIDRRNHHLFQPLLYQVAAALLAPSDIAWPIRHLLRRQRHVRTLLGTVIGIDQRERSVVLDDGTSVSYDYLVLATGARHAYFGHDEWESYAPGLKTLEDATHIRRRVLMAFERAERENDPERLQQLLTFVVVGGGPTGVELAGTIAELARHTLPGDFRNFDPRDARVILVEAGPRILPAFRPELSTYATKALGRLGVVVRTGQPVTSLDSRRVTLGSETIAASTIVWAAGVQASPVADWLGAPKDRAGRVQVAADLTVPDQPDIFVIGDAAVIYSDGRLVPGVAPAAKQQGRHVARVIRLRVKGDTGVYRFRYREQARLATIGRRAAVVDFGWMQLKGSLAWWFWGAAHIFFLIGLRNRLAVALDWLWIHAAGRRGARLITQPDTSDPGD